MKTSFIALLLAFCQGVALGELKWDRQRVELSPGPADPFVDATFGFVNVGKEPVTIENLEPSCGCTTASLSKKTIAPGERSEVVVRFDLTGRRGVQTKTVTMHIKGEKAPTILALVVTIPDLVKVDPMLVIWEKGEEAKPKTILLKCFEGHPVKIVSLVSSEGGFKAKLETIREGRQYAVTVTPGSTATPTFSVLTIAAEFKGEERVVRAYAQVKGGPQ